MVVFKQEESYGFIRPRGSLPTDYTNKNVHFSSNGVRYVEGDEVEFVLRDTDKARPSAKRVWIVRRAGPLVKQLLKGDSACTLGQITRISPYDREGWIQVISNVEADCDSQGVYFQESWVTCGYMDLQPGDIVEFKLSPSRKRDGEMAAHQIRLSECKQRSQSEIHRYICKVTNKLCLMTDTDTELTCGLMSCTAVWDAIGQCKDMSPETVLALVDYIKLLHAKAQGYNEKFKEVIKSLVYSNFCNTQDGQLKRYLQGEWEQTPEEWREKIKQFLIIILDCVPEKSRMVVTLMKPMLSSDQNSFEHFMFTVMKKITARNQDDISDLEWDELPLVPSASELLSNRHEGEATRLKQVKVKGQYESAEEYMDIYFRLLRADCFSALQKGISSYLENTLDPRDMFVYTGVSLEGVSISEKGQGVALALRVTPLNPVNNWETCSNLTYGNLLCLSPTGSFKDPIWATVTQRDVKVLKSKQIVWVELCDLCNTVDSSTSLIQITSASGRIIMAESPTYYVAYQPVLKALQEMDPSEMAFSDELIYLDDPKPPPTAETTTLDQTSSLDEMSLLERLKMMRLHSLTNRESLLAAKGKARTPPASMDESQKEAFKQALQNRVAVIQGPPGTGKTYIGIKLVEALLSEESLQLPILVLTYKNHALDEFLKELIRLLPGEVVRIGGRSQDPIVEGCNLQKLRREGHRTSTNHAQWCALRDQASALKPEMVSSFRDFIRAKTFSLSHVLEGFTETQIEGLLRQCSLVLYVDDEYTGTTLLVSVAQVLPIWHREKEYLLNKSVPFPKKCVRANQVLLKFLNAAIFEWMPPKEEFIKMSQVEERLSTLLAGHNPLANDRRKKKTRKVEDQLLPDEKDAIDEEQERKAAAGAKSKSDYDFDVVVQREIRHDKNMPNIIPSAHQLADEIPLTAIDQVKDLWSLSPYERAAVVQVLLWHHKTEVEKKLEKQIMTSREITAKLKEIDNENAVAIMKKKKVVGMTITGASINNSLLKMLKPSVVIVEEAAEVLEPQIAAVLGSWVKHLILIGDHKQLRPPVENYNLCRNFHFDVSMMERLINNDYPHTTLKLQNRMRPEMAELLLDIYPDLKSNLQRVEKHNPPSFTHSMFFWSHEDPEEKARSFSNMAEAERVIQLALVFLQMGYKPRQITILAAYQGQVSLLRRLLRKAESEHADIFTSRIPTTIQHLNLTKEELEDALKFINTKPSDDDIDRYMSEKRLHKQEIFDWFRNPDENKVKIHTIDLYQGDENDIIIVSLVRSNNESKIGFLGTLNRRCVAQSRAKCGMYFVGNESTFSKARGSCWYNLINDLHEQKLVSPQFPMYCPIHMGITQIKAKTAQDLPLKEICKVDCNVEMECGIHRCPKLCRPYHSHEEWACKQIVDFVLPCGHPAKRKCCQSEESIQCKKPCQEMMICLRHFCPETCDPQHSHRKELCSVSVDFIHQICKHAGKKRCGDDASKQTCSEKVFFLFKGCKHSCKRLCYEKEENMFCKEPCSRQLPCGHPCEGCCGEDPCNASKCTPCEEKRLHEEKQKREAEENLRKLAREAAKKELQEFKEKHETLDCHCMDLTREGDTASEYFDVEDRVKKYIQPGHDWFPRVTRVEKITNLKLQMQWIEAKSEMFDPLRSELKFHGTDQQSIKNIVKDGFKLPRKKSKAGMYGRGIYFATDSSKSAQAKYTKGSNMLLLCDVLIGKSRTEKKANPDMNFATLQTAGYDSIFAPRNTKQMGGVCYDEYVVYKPAQALPRYVVHYETCGISAIKLLPMDPAAGTEMKKHELLPKRGFDPSNPLDMHFRLAESQFLRLKGSTTKVKSVDYYINPKLQEAFTKKQKDFSKKYPVKEYSETVLAFHGTDAGNIESIMKNNFRMEDCRRGVHGAGIYLSEFPDTSEEYAKGAKKLILCKILPGKGFRGGKSGSRLEAHYDSHTVDEDQLGRAWAHVIYDPNQILPVYVINY